MCIFVWFWEGHTRDRLVQYAHPLNANQQRDGIFKVDTFVRYGYQKLMHRACWESRIETPVDQLGHPYMQIYAGLWGLTP